MKLRATTIAALLTLLAAACGTRNPVAVQAAPDAPAKEESSPAMGSGH